MEIHVCQRGHVSKTGIMQEELSPQRHESEYREQTIKVIDNHPVEQRTEPNSFTSTPTKRSLETTAWKTPQNRTEV